MVLAEQDVEPGHWDQAARSFEALRAPLNAVRVTTRKSNANGNALDLILIHVLGPRVASVSASAVAIKGTALTRFLIDEDVIDSDVPAIEALAARMGVPSDRLIEDGDGDWFIDLPPGARLELPTGQLGDEGLMDIDHPSHPFSSQSDPSHADFLNYNEDSGSWRYDLVPKSMLDPLHGVSAVNDPSKYPGYVDPDLIHVSPVYKSDISVLTASPPKVNALGWRRGLLAFKIVAIGVDPDGAGSCLPNVIIEVVNPNGIDIDEVATPRSGSSLRLVQ